SVGPGDEPPPWIAQLAVIILAVPDDAIRPLAGVLADAGTIGSQQVVLHLSGVHGQEALGPLVGSRAALGSLHPLQTISDPERAAERLKGAWAAVEGMPRAVEAAERLAQDVGLRPFRIASQEKPMYHAGAVFASNYFVVVEAVAQRLLGHAGLTDAEAWQALRRGWVGRSDRRRPAACADPRITSYSAGLPALRGDREPLFEAVVEEVALGSKLRYSVLTLTALSGFFGLVAGAYSSPAQAV